jgi:hypothetical protein
LVSTPNGRPEVNIVGGLAAWFGTCPEAWFVTGSEIGSEIGSEAGFEARFEAGFEARSEGGLDAGFGAGLELCRKPSRKADDGAESEVGMA